MFLQNDYLVFTLQHRLLKRKTEHTNLSTKRKVLPSPVIPARLIGFMNGSLRKRAGVAISPSSIGKVQVSITNISNQ
jgi:hypothetical protein